MSKFKINQRVWFRGGIGGTQAPKAGTIVGKGSRHGEAVYDVKLDTGEIRWAYRKHVKLMEGADDAPQA